MWQKIKSVCETIFDLFYIFFELLFTDPLLVLMLLSPVLLIAGAVFFFFDFTVTCTVLLVLGAIGVAVGIWEIFF